MTRRFAPADALTGANAACGLAVVALAASGGVAAACVALLVAGCVLDALDGPLARRCGAGRHGVQLDVAADLLTFGVAPAALLARLALSGEGPWTGPLLGAAAAFVLAAAYRLRRHAAGPARTPAFAGLPMPAAGAAATGLALVHPALPLAAAMTLALALLMVSRLPYPRPSRRLLPALAACVALGWLAAAAVVPLDVVALGWLAAVAALPLSRVVQKHSLAQK